MAKESSSGMRPKTIPGHLAAPQSRSKILPSSNPSKGNQLTSPINVLYELVFKIWISPQNDTNDAILVNAFHHGLLLAISLQTLGSRCAVTGIIFPVPDVWEYWRQ